MRRDIQANYLSDVLFSHHLSIIISDEILRTLSSVPEDSILSQSCVPSTGDSLLTSRNVRTRTEARLSPRMPAKSKARRVFYRAPAKLGNERIQQFAVP